MEDEDEPEKKRYLVRTNCEYSIEIEATSEEEALKEAEKIPCSEWGQAWAPYEAEDVPYREPISGPGGVGRTDLPYGQGGGDD